MYGDNQRETEQDYRTILENDPHSVSALLGLADCAIDESLDIAEKLFKIAAREAEQQRDCSGYIRALEGLAFLSNEQGDNDSLEKYFNEMYEVFKRLDGTTVPGLGLVQLLLEDGHGAKAIPYLERVADQLMRRRKRTGYGWIVTRLLGEVHEQSKTSL